MVGTTVRGVDMRLLLLLLISFNTVAEDRVSLYLGLGIGNVYDADTSGKSMYSLAAIKGDWRAEIAYWEEYTRSEWWDTDPDWRPTKPRTVIKSHSVLSVTNTIYKKNLGNGLEFFYDFGLALTDSKSSVNSSYLLFKHNLGFTYKSCSVYLSHKSNAGLAGVNAGEDGVTVMCGIGW